MAPADRGGVWFVRPSDNSRTKVSENFAVNRPNELVIQVPALAMDRYRLEIVTQYSSGNTLLKEPRTISFGPELAALPKPLRGLPWLQRHQEGNLRPAGLG
jgi:hypothetical protein